MKITLEQLYKNNRYRMFKLEDKYYLIDCDSSIWFYIFPFLVYFWEHKCYEITQAEYEELVIPSELQQKYLNELKSAKGITMSISLLAPLILKRINPLIQINSNILFSFLVYVVFFSMLFWKVLYTVRCYMKLKSENRSILSVKLFPATRKLMLQKIYIYIFCIVALLCSIAMVTISITKDYLMLYCLAIFEIIYLFLNNVFLGIGEYNIKKVNSISKK